MRSSWYVLLACCAFAPASALVAQEEPTIVEASGTGEVAVAPDHATLFVGVRAQEPSAERAASVMSRQIDAVVDTLEALGISRDSLPTERFRISTERSFSEGETTGYSAAVTLRVRTTELERIVELVDAAVSAGATEISRVEFGSTRADSARSEALRLALRAARTDAEVIAEAQGGRLGRLVHVSTVPGRQARVALRGEDREIGMLPPPLSSVAFSPRDITVQASVLATWEMLSPLPRPAAVRERVAPAAAAAALAFVADSIRPPIERDDRLWLAVGEEEGDAVSPHRDAELLHAVRRTFPGARTAPAGTDLFLCPEGESVRMPGHGCPIFEDGRIVAFRQRGPVGEGGVHLEVRVTSTACAGECTWMDGWGLDLDREPDGRWTVRQVRYRSVT